MAVVIRLRRTGRKNLPCYRIVVSDSRFPRDGRNIETLGHYDPRRRDPATQVVVDVERSKKWVADGARITHVVASIFRKKGVLETKNRPRRDRSGRGTKTATATRRKTRDTRVAQAKLARRTERLKTRSAAKKAAAAAGAEAKS